MEQLLAILSQQDRVPLSAWYAEPLSEEDAGQLLQAQYQAQQESLQAGRQCIYCGLIEMIAHHFLGRGIASEYAVLLKVHADRAMQALIELVYGQLLMSCKLAGAIDHLTRGFNGAAEFMSAEEYLQVMKRHEVLAYLSLSKQPSLPQSLTDLTSEAIAIRELNRSAGVKSSPYTDRKDTIG